MGADGDDFTGHKAHRKPAKGRKSDKKDGKRDKKDENLHPKLRNPKAFAINSVVRAERKFRRAQDHETKKERVPLVDRSPVEPPPFIVAVVGPPKVGKTTLLTNLIRNYTRQNLTELKGPVTVVTGKKRRLTFIECNNDIHSMIDVAKVADLTLLLVDASFGFEMEVFEFLNICQVHGFPQIMGVLTHLDQFRNKKKLKKTKKTLKHRFWTEVYPGAKLFYLSGYFPMTNTYPKNEVHNLARFISVMKFRPTNWRLEHSYIVADRMEDLTEGEALRKDGKVDRKICLYGWVHGTFLKESVSVHIPGLGDFTPDAITALQDPCPLPMKERVLRRSLNEKEKVIYAPFSGVGGIVYDQDAVYIDLGGSHSHGRRNHDREAQEEGMKQQGGSSFVQELRDLKTTLDEKMDSAGLKLFSGSEAITGAQVEEMEEEGEDVNMDETEDNDDHLNKKFTPILAKDGRIRRRVVFDDEDEDVTETISREIATLKRQDGSDGEDEIMGKTRKRYDHFEDEDESAEESEQDQIVDSDDDEETPSTNKLKTPTHPQLRKAAVVPDVDEDSISCLVSKIKSKLHEDKTLEYNNVNKMKKVAEHLEIATGGQVEFEDEDESVDEDEDEEEEKDALNLLSDEDDDNEETDNEDEEEHTSQNSRMIVNKTVAESMEKSLSKEKAQRLSLAEEAFYSRFQNRSIQKMIYDDADDYLNVSSRADFDLANCTLTSTIQQSQDNEYQTGDDELKDLFIGGDYAETAQKLLDADDDEGGEDEDVFGDFEELDDTNGTSGTKGKKIPTDESDKSAQKKREELKKKLKEKFDMDYDGGGDGEDGDEKSFYRDCKAQVEEQTKINRNFFDDVEDTRLLQDLQGLSPGTYVRVEISRVPAEFVLNFDPQRCSPLIVGSLDSSNQETLAVVQARVKKHRWHPKILKTRDPIIMSVGWRRFQTVALYSVQDHNMRNRMIKYTPEHLHCIANFYGPMTPQGTGILGLAPSSFSSGFRITLTGTILDMDKSSELVKKLKLVGSPAKIFKKSAFIEGMFSSQLEVAKFIGAKIKTVSGIRGVIKKELRTPLGGFRATFEDKIVSSDIVFCRTWARVEVPKFFLNLPTLITSQPRVMKTVGELKREQQLKIEPNPDHLYTPVQRTEKHFRELKIPKSLQGRLPYKDKPKLGAKLIEQKRIAVIKDPKEREMSKFLKTLKTRMSDKDAVEKAVKAKKTGEREKVLKKMEERHGKREKELRKKVFRTLGQMNKKEEQHAGSRGRGGHSSRGRGGLGGGGGRPHRHQRN